MKFSILLFGLIGLGINTSRATAQTTVTVDIVGRGKVKGIEEATSGPNDNSMYAFYGIPFGKDTSGSNRFKPTSYPDPWTETRDCSQPNLERICPQAKRKVPVGQEDCLDLSIYTPNVPHSDSDALYPVLVFFHAGRFVEEHNYLYHGANVLNSNEIVLVVPNYRLGILGFMCLHEEEAPCNAGLYDLVLALQWVQDYIEHFGGDPNRVTISGSGAGSALAHYLMTYQDNNKAYFDQVIAAGSTSLGIASLDQSPVSIAKGFGSLLGCNMADNTDFINCMRDISADNLTKNFYRDYISDGYTGAFPAVQQWGTDRIIRDHPRTILQQSPPSFGVVPTFLGTTKHEGSFIAGFLYHITPVASDPTWWTTKCIPFLTEASNTPGETGDDIFNTYFGGVYPTNFTEGVGKLIDACGAIYYKSGVDEIASSIQAAGGDVFVYSFDYKGSLTTFGQFGPIPVPAGVSHGDDILYIFSDSASFTAEDKVARDNIIKVWINFIKTGNPGENTPIYKATDRGYLEITDTFAIRADYRDSFFPCKGVSGDEDNCVYTP